MSGAAISLAIVRFLVWELALFAAAVRVARRLGWHDSGAEFWLAVLSIEITLESSAAALFSFTGMNSAAAYWIAAGACAVIGFAGLRAVEWRGKRPAPFAGIALAALATPLVLLSFRPVEEIDSINYLHYLIDWMGNRATPYTFATNYVAFWELSFLPAWTVTRVDLFFPLLAAKAVVLLGLAAWLIGREFEVPRGLLLWAVAASLAMRHFWFDYSGVPTLKNDALHGAGFVLLLLVVMRAARRELAAADLGLLAFGAAFASVKYTGIFLAVIAAVLVTALRRPGARAWLGAAVFFVLTSGHYYLHNFAQYGSPFYPFQINLGPVHLPGTADLSNTSILYSLHDPRLWRAFFLPAGGVSPAGLLFPAILAGILVTAAAICLRAAWGCLRHHAHPAPAEWAAFLILCGWLLYFRSVFSASGYAGDLAFILNNLNSVRYVDGVLAASEVLLVSLLARFTWVVWPLVGLNLASRLAELYGKIPGAVFPLWVVVGAALAIALLLLAARRRAVPVAVLCAAICGPLTVERNRLQWTTYWNDLKPSLEAVRGKGLAELALPDGGYFAGHAVAAGDPVDPAVRAVSEEDLDRMAADARPQYLAVLVTTGSAAARDWRERYGRQLAKWGYTAGVEGSYGALMRRQF